MEHVFETQIKSNQITTTSEAFDDFDRNSGSRFFFTSRIHLMVQPGHIISDFWDYWVFWVFVTQATQPGVTSPPTCVQVVHYATPPPSTRAIGKFFQMLS